jgi:acyl-coenzyme A synthetase/AMP-(fatty) acid ligase
MEVSPSRQEVTRTLEPVSGSLLEQLGESEGPAIESTVESEKPLSYKDLQAFLQSTGCLPHRGIAKGDVVAVILPNGPELALVLLACFAYSTAAPLDGTMKEAELVDALEQLKVKHVIAMRGQTVCDENIVQAAKSAGSRLGTKIELHYIVNDTSKAGAFVWADAVALDRVGRDATVNGPEDVALILRTSGTTSKPKVVPCSLGGILLGAKCISSELGLKPTDRTLNVMPLTHIGGISSSLLSTLVSGGTVRCTPGFNPGLFGGWITTAPEPSWYYAVPTIHSAVLLACPEPGDHKLRLIRSGAAALPHKVAEELKGRFGCTVYPTYSMTECMPIAQPPAGYGLEKPIRYTHRETKGPVNGLWNGP